MKLESEKVDGNQAKLLVVKPLNMQTCRVRITGTSPYMQHKFSQKAKTKIEQTQKQGQQAKAKKMREPRDFEADYEAAKHKDAQGRMGIPAAAFRNGMISVAGRTCGFKMTVMKLAVFVDGDTYDAENGEPLVFIEGDPVMDMRPARNDNGGCDLRARPRWDKWAANLTLRWDGDQLSKDSVVALLGRVGAVGGVGEGRPDSRDSAGFGYGLFSVEEIQG